MRSFIILATCVCSLAAVGQTSSPQAPTAKAPSTVSAQEHKAETPAGPTEKPSSPNPQNAGPTAVAPEAAVITIKGLCSTPAPRATSGKAAVASAAKPATCETVITRKQLELVIDSVRPNLQPAQRRMLAQQYVELLTLANAATKAGTEKDPKVQEQMRLSKMQILATSYSREVQQKKSEVPDADIAQYYKDHAQQYEQAKLLRIYVPMVTAEEGKPPDAAASKALAEKIQQRAAAGEDFEKLQKEAFAAANNKGTAPSVDMGERRRGTLPPKQEDAVFRLKAGEVTPALEEPSGFYIYKVSSKDQAPVDKVHDEIKATLARERFRESMDKLKASVETKFNDKYFETGTQPASSAGPARPTVPPAPSPQKPSAVAAPAAPAAAQPSPAQPATTTSSPEAPKTPPPGPPPGK
jgi:peptidyl-prolyl cis-trans isomerase C